MYDVVLDDGSVVAEVSNTAVSVSLIKEVYSWKQEGASWDDILCRLRLRCVPSGYTPQPWISGINACLHWRKLLLENFYQKYIIIRRKS